MGFSKEMAIHEEEARVREIGYLDAERYYYADKLMEAIFNRPIAKKEIVKGRRKDAKNHYLYRNLKGKLRLV